MRAIKKTLQWVTKKINTISVGSGAMKYIVWYALLLVACCLLYIGGWCVEWHKTGNPDLSAMLDFLREIASASWVAVIGFVAKSFVDNNNNGIPDELEKEDEET